MTIVIILLGIIGILTLYIVSTHNALVQTRNQVAKASADIDTVLKRRYDLIPNLVEVVKGYASHEKNVLENVIKARAGLLQDDKNIAMKADSILTQSLKSLFAVVENYPELRANENFKSLQEELSNTENVIATHRNNYNSVVKYFNDRVQMFPSNIIASTFGFKVVPFIEASEKEKEVPKVHFQ